MINFVCRLGIIIQVTFPVKKRLNLDISPLRGWQINLLHDFANSKQEGMYMKTTTHSELLKFMLA